MDQKVSKCSQVGLNKHLAGRERWLSALSALSGTIKTVTMFHYQFLKEKQNLFAVNVFEINYLITLFFFLFKENRFSNNQYSKNCLKELYIKLAFKGHTLS